MNITLKPEFMKTKVRQFEGVKNQFKIFAPEGTYFQSYDSIIAFKPNTGKVQLDENYWDYSKTTGKYRNLFLGEDKKATQKKIDSGVYELKNLNE